MNTKWVDTGETMFIDVKRAHLVPKCIEDVTNNSYKDELQAEAHVTVSVASPLEGHDTALAARSDYLAQDDPCIQFPAKENCWSVANPIAQDLQTKRELREAFAQEGRRSAQITYRCSRTAMGRASWACDGPRQAGS